MEIIPGELLLLRDPEGYLAGGWGNHVTFITNSNYKGHAVSSMITNYIYSGNYFTRVNDQMPFNHWDPFYTLSNSNNIVIKHMSGTKNFPLKSMKAYCWSMNAALVEIETEVESNYVESQLRSIHQHGKPPNLSGYPACRSASVS